MIEWIFIGIGFVGGIALTIAAIFNFVKWVKTKKVDHISLSTQIVFTIASIAFFIYALGLSIFNGGSERFWYSAPTWFGNFIPLIFNSILLTAKIVAIKKGKHA